MSIEISQRNTKHTRRGLDTEANMFGQAAAAVGTVRRALEC